jgi:peptidoglycan L-alanyl-D-glutamate endopeptidase CwlK
LVLFYIQGKNMILVEGNKGERVQALQQTLKNKGFDPGNVDGDFGPATEAAVISFQKSEGLLADGKAGPNTLSELGLDVLEEDKRGDATTQFTVAVVSKMSPNSPIGNIKTHLPNILSALKELDLDDRDMILMAIGTIRAETEGFEPINEFKSRFNTAPGGTPFGLFDNRKDLGNQGHPDGSSFKGRGFVQLTGRANYTKIGSQIGVDLVNNPDKANDSVIASKILARFLKNKERQIREALLLRNKGKELRKKGLGIARKAVNGGDHGIERFVAAFDTGDSLIA